MALMFFWIKVGLKRVLEAFKARPAFVILFVLVIAAFVYAIVNKYIVAELDAQKLAIIMPIFILSPFFGSFMRYNLMPEFLKYSKSKFGNNTICVRFFVTKAIVNNLWLLILIMFIYYALTDKKYFYILPIANIFSIFLSFLLMYTKNKYTNRKIAKIAIKRLNINPKIKSAMYDYSSGFLFIAVICIVLFFIAIIGSTKDLHYLYEMENPSSFFSAITIIFSFGFMGIIGSIPNINWKFQAIMTPNNFKYHIKRTLLFLGGFYGWLLVIFILLGSFINLVLLLKYVYCIFVLFLAAIFISWSISHSIIKLMIFVLIVALTIWVSAAPAIYLPILIIPVLITLGMAKSDYKEWSVS
jgi:hypothetical protein